MAKITFILGLCASGKTHFLKELLKEAPNSLYLDEGFIGENGVNFNKNYSILKKSLQEGKDYIIVEIGFCEEKARELILDRLNNDFSQIEIVWKCFENVPEKANKNVEHRAKKGENKDIVGHININAKYLSYIPIQKMRKK